MNAHDILTALRKMGKPQTAAIYKRHGARASAFAVLPCEIARMW